MSEERILEGLGKLSGLVEASRGDIKTIKEKQEEQSECLQKVQTSIKVIETSYNSRATQCGKDFQEINNKLGRDYLVLNELKTKAIVANGVEDYKGKKRIWWQWLLGIIGAIFGIIFTLNQLAGLVQKIKLSTLPSAPSAYSALLNPGMGLQDSTKLNMPFFKMEP